MNELIRTMLSRPPKLLRSLAKATAGREAYIFAALAIAAFTAAFVALNFWVWKGEPRWHLWFDQGRYLDAARALSDWDMSPSRHNYPPLYPLMAALFVRIMPIDPFFLIDAGCIGISVFLIVRMFGTLLNPLFVGLWSLLFLLMPRNLAETFIVPWTTTPSVALTLLAFYSIWRMSGGLEMTSAVLFGAAIGLLIPTRPLEAVLVSTLLPFWIWQFFRITSGRNGRLMMFDLVRCGLVMTFPVVLGAAVLFAFNLKVFGGLQSSYMEMSGLRFSARGFLARAVSLLSDSDGLYGVSGQTLLARFYWLPLGVIASAVCASFGPVWLRAAVFFGAIQFSVYTCYTDMTPISLLKYLNYHYFKGALWLAFLMVPVAIKIVSQKSDSKSVYVYAALLITAGLVGSLHLVPQDHELQSVLDDRQLTIAAHDAFGDQFIDVSGLSRHTFEETYFSDPKISADGASLSMFSDVRAFPIAGGTRFLFVKSISASSISIPISGWVVARSGVSGRSGRVRLAIGPGAKTR